MVKLQYVPTMEYYAAIKRNKLLIHATIWMGLKGMMVGGGVRANLKMLHCMIPFM